ncbi:MAG: carboxypeptidase-like regulatory domain-containing protein [Terriglobales bacterium]
MFDWSGSHFRRSLPVFFILLTSSTSTMLSHSLWAQEAASENPNAGTIQGTVRSEDGTAVESARISYISSATDTRGVTRTGQDGAYVTEQLPPGVYLVHVDGRDLLPAETTVTVTGGASATVNFKLDWINPGPARLESHFAGDAPDQQPINGRNYLGAGELLPGVHVVDGAVYGPAKSGFQSLSIDSALGRNTHYDIDEIEAMDETNGAATTSLPIDAVREVIVSRATPEVFQSLNATGSVRIATRSGGDNWHGDLFGNLRDQFLGLAGFPAGNSDYSRQQYGFGLGGPLVGGPLAKAKAFFFLGGERTKQDGRQPMMTQDLILPSGNGSPVFNSTALQSAYFRQNMLTARLDYNLNEDKKIFVRLGYDNANLVGPENSLSMWRNQINVPSAAFGLDWNRGRFVHSARFGYQKFVNAITPDLGDSTVLPSAPFRMQIGSFSLGPTTAGPRQTIQRDLFARWDSSTLYKVNHTLRFGGAFHHILQGDYFPLGSNGPSVTSSNGLATITAINDNPALLPLYPGDPRGAADNPLNYPVGTFTIYNGLGNFSENSAFNRNTGGHSDYRFEGYAADTFNVIPNVNVTIGVNYVFDTGRTDSDLAAIPQLNQFAQFPPTGAYIPPLVTGSILRPLKNFAPQFGVAWDPGHNGRTVVRANGGMFFDNFLLQNTYQDRINRLANGQYNRSLTLCPTGSVLFPDGSVVSSVNGVDIASGICGQPIGNVSGLIQQLESNFLTTQSGIANNAPNVYSLQNSLADFGGMLAPGFKTPRVVHMSAGLERQMGERSVFSVDYVRELGTQFPLGIDTNHVGDSALLNNGDNLDVTQNTYAAELSAINNTLLAASAPCAPATFAGPGPNGSQAAVDCYLSNVSTASIVDFAGQGLDSSNAFCGPFPCSALGKIDKTTGKPMQASFGGANPAVGSNIMYFPSGRSQYQAIHFAYHTTSAVNPLRRVQKIDVGISYTLSRYRSNIAEPSGAGGDYSILNVAEDYLRPHLGHFGSSGLDRTHQIVISPTVEMPHGPRLSIITLLGSPLPLTVSVPQLNGGGVPGEIFRSDLSGDGTVGDILNGTYIGSTGKYSPTNVDKAIASYNQSQGGNLTPAGFALVSSALFRSDQLSKLGAVAPYISSCSPPSPACGLPGRWAAENWFKTVDLRLSWPFALGERAKIEPIFTIFNAFNLANYGGPGAQLSGILDGSPGTSLNNSTVPGYCGSSASLCTSRLDRVLPGSGTYANGAPRQLQFGVRVTF